METTIALLVMDTVGVLVNVECGQDVSDDTSMLIPTTIVPGTPGDTNALPT